jgi:hypothetical protein
VNDLAPYQGAARFRLVIGGVLLALLAQSVHAEWADWTAEGRLGMQFNDNVNRAPSGPGSIRKSDYAGFIGLTGGRWYQLTDFSRFRLAGQVDAYFFTQYDRLDFVTPRVLANIYHKFGIGQTVPWGNVFAAAEFHDARSDLWDYGRVDIGAEAGKRFSDRLAATLRYGYEQRFGRNNRPLAGARSGRVMDQFAHSFSFRGEYLLTESIALDAGYTYRNGNFVSDNSPLHVMGVLPFAEAATRDPDTFGQTFWLYRIRGHTHYGYVYASYAFNDLASFNIGYEIQYGEAKRWTYKSNLVSASLVLAY